MSNVWFTPELISLFIMENFPNSEVRGEIEQGAFLLKWHLSSLEKDVYIRNAVDSEAFQTELFRFVKETEFAKLVGLRPPELQTSRFSLVCGLKDWGKFQRAALKKTDECCTELLMSSLEGDENAPQELEELGLAPGKLEEGPVDQNDLEIFRKLTKKLEEVEKTDGDRARAIFQKLEEAYPLVFRKIWDDMRQEAMMSSVSSGQAGYREILDHLNQKVIGQGKATELVANTLAGQQNSNEKNQFFLFVGPTGVGKTELAKATAGLKEDRFIMLCMNRYAQPETSTNLFGSPPGYVGSTSQPHFVQEIKKSFQPVEKGREGNTTTYEVRDVVILFDEMEKADSKIKLSLLDLFMEGKYKAQYSNRIFDENVTEVYLFVGAIFVATSNLYHQQILRCYEQDSTPEQIASSFIEWNERFPSPQSFAPEFLSRGTVVPFGPIPRGRESYQRIIEIKLDLNINSLKEELPCKAVHLEGKEEILQILEGLLYGNGTDIRKIDRFFHNSATRNIRALSDSHCVPLQDKTVVLFPQSLFPQSEHRAVGVRFTKLRFGKTMSFGDLLLYNPLEGDPL